jgi:hypothetical protein
MVNRSHAYPLYAYDPLKRVITMRHTKIYLITLLHNLRALSVHVSLIF